MRDLPQRRRFRSLYLWHRYFGLVAALFVTLLAVSGVLVQHAHTLGLQEIHLGNRLLLQWYGLTSNPVVSYSTQSHWVSQSGEYIYINAHPVQGKYADLLGAVDSGLLLALISTESVMLFTQKGELVENIGQDAGLPEKPLGIGYHTSEGVIIQGESASWQPDENWLNWRKYKGTPPDWSKPQAAPEALFDKIRQHNLSHELTWERFLLDLHSGRLLGKYGIYIMDLAALAMLFLAFSGTLVWMQRRPSRRFRGTEKKRRH